MKGLTREGTLAELETLGKEIAWSANPSNYPFERRDRAKEYDNMLYETRRVYAAIRDGADAEETLIRLQQHIPTGVERNRLNLLITAQHGFGNGNCRAVVNDRIVFVKE